jgi:hypothetical protein
MSSVFKLEDFSIIRQPMILVWKTKVKEIMTDMSALETSDTIYTTATRLLWINVECNDLIRNLP